MFVQLQMFLVLLEARSIEISLTKDIDCVFPPFIVEK